MAAARQQRLAPNALARTAGIFAFVLPEPRTPIVTGNSVAVLGDDGVLVVDSGQFPSVTRKIIGEIRQITDQPVRFVANTLWHPDHWAGNGEYGAAFPGVVIVSTGYTREQIGTKAQPFVDAVIYVPDAKVVMTGDLVVAAWSCGIGSSIRDWIGTLSRLTALDAATIVSGARAGPTRQELCQDRF